MDGATLAGLSGKEPPESGSQTAAHAEQKSSKRSGSVITSPRRK